MVIVDRFSGWPEIAHCGILTCPPLHSGLVIPSQSLSSAGINLDLSSQLDQCNRECSRIFPNHIYLKNHKNTKKINKIKK